MSAIVEGCSLLDLRAASDGRSEWSFQGAQCSDASFDELSIDEQAKGAADHGPAPLSSSVLQLEGLATAAECDLLLQALTLTISLTLTLTLTLSPQP